ncbi:hypothetical protein LO762_24825 [Actinocorallia sp. API 0066]|nr:hypothetical protein [Actinocorallia sp. API 0066]MCD0452388.1 hypothetical protein [Actinocorallia sp. API 0066]
MQRLTPQQDSLLIDIEGLAASDTALDLVLGRKATIGIGGFDNKMAQ